MRYVEGSETPTFLQQLNDAESIIDEQQQLPMLSPEFSPILFELSVRDDESTPPDMLSGGVDVGECT